MLLCVFHMAERNFILIFGVYYGLFTIPNFTNYITNDLTLRFIYTKFLSCHIPLSYSIVSILSHHWYQFDINSLLKYGYLKAVNPRALYCLGYGYNNFPLQWIPQTFACPREIWLCWHNKVVLT